MYTAEGIVKAGQALEMDEPGWRTWAWVNMYLYSTVKLDLL
jgi:hypothetical protein